MNLMTEYSPPYLHPRYLTNAQQALCESNPTYATRLADLRTLRDEVEQIRGLLAALEVSKLPEFAGISRKHSVKRSGREGKDSASVMEEEKRELSELEEMMLRWDNELAALAEGLISRPKVRLPF